MPRDVNGNYTLPLPAVIPGTTVDAVWANTTLDDVAVAITDSLDRQGRGGMLVPFLNADGAINAPGMAWSNEPTSGFYREALGDQRVSILGNALMRWNDSKTSVWVVDAWKDVIYAGGPGAIPDGTVDNQVVKWLTDTWVVGQVLWGEVGGDIADQTDLVALLANYTLLTTFDAHASDVDIHFADAPSDGVPYARKDLGWVVIPDAATTSWGTITGTLSNQTDLQAALDAKANKLVTINAQTGTAYVLAITDELVTMDNAAANTLDVPLEATVTLPVGFRAEVASIGAGQTTVTPEGAVVIISKDSLLALTAQGSGATLTKLATDTWLLVGDLA